ncbi:MAG TPA: hypothetical protein VG387_20850 [Rhizomicrobium sp.]|nr:hypothetical protein [Rhizomicrobium sp.]
MDHVEASIRTFKCRRCRARFPCGMFIGDTDMIVLDLVPATDPSSGHVALGRLHPSEYVGHDAGTAARLFEQRASDALLGAFKVVRPSATKPPRGHKPYVRCIVCGTGDAAGVDEMSVAQFVARGGS